MLPILYFEKNILKKNFFFPFTFWPYYAAYRFLVPCPGIKPMPLAVKTQSPNHWTAREFPGKNTFLKKIAG